MRRITREPLPSATEQALNRRQQVADEKRTDAKLDVDREWKGARKSKPLLTVLETLRHMAGERQRCMYCGDSHGTDIEHFWPKTGFPERMFQWLNMLLCCTECGRFKGGRFPLDGNGAPLLIDPTSDNPWNFVDFEPATNAFVARFDTSIDAPSPRGEETVRILQLDRREALEAGYGITNRRIRAAVVRALPEAAPDAEALCRELREADAHGLLGWYFSGTGRNATPFRELRIRHPAVWAACATAFC